MEKTHPLQPSIALLSKIGSIAVHAQELFGPMGHQLDSEAMKALLSDPEVCEWIEEMTVYLPRKRGSATGLEKGAL